MVFPAREEELETTELNHGQACECFFCPLHVLLAHFAPKYIWREHSVMSSPLAEIHRQSPKDSNAEKNVMQSKTDSQAEEKENLKDKTEW